jgi:hypothetical protein
MKNLKFEAKKKKIKRKTKKENNLDGKIEFGFLKLFEILKWSVYENIMSSGYFYLTLSSFF